LEHEDGKSTCTCCNSCQLTFACVRSIYGAWRHRNRALSVLRLFRIPVLWQLRLRARLSRVSYGYAPAYRGYYNYAYAPAYRGYFNYVPGYYYGRQRW
jgi:hypothetical protein